MTRSLALYKAVTRVVEALRAQQLELARERAEALRATCHAADRPLAEACCAIVAWRAGSASGGPLDHGLVEAIAGVDRLQQAGCGRALGWVACVIGNAIGLLGDVETGIEWLEQGIDDATQREARRDLVIAYSYKASLLAYSEEREQAHSLFLQALALCEGEARPIRGGLLNNLAFCRILQARDAGRGDPACLALAQEAVRYADDALAESASPGYGTWRGQALGNRGAALGILARFAEAEAAFEEALEEPGLTPRARKALLIDRAEVLVVAGRFAEAAAQLARVEAAPQHDLLDRAGDRMFELQIAVARHFGRHEEAQALWEPRFRQLADRHRDRLRNVRRYGELKAELKLARAALLESRHRERESLLGDLHDGFGSQLLSASLAARRGALTQADMVKILDECIADMHLVLDTLSLDEGRLGDALRFLRNRLESRLSGRPIALSWAIELDNAPILAQQRIVQVLRVVQEAIANALKHAQASHLRVEARVASPGQLLVTIRDDGVGLAPERGEGRGLGSMRSRALGLGGTLTLEKHSGAGTLVRLAFPAP